MVALAMSVFQSREDGGAAATPSPGPPVYRR
jgi:hypothetical protein